MSNVVTALFAIAIILGGTATLTASTFSSASTVSASLEDMVERRGERARTQLTLVQADIAGSGPDVDISLRNTGQVPLANFDRWDVVIRYYQKTNNRELTVRRLVYTSGTPTDGQWTVEGIYLDASSSTPEVFDPGILNPGEEVVLRLTISPAVPNNTDNLVKIATDNGVTVEAPFSR